MSGLETRSRGPALCPCCLPFLSVSRMRTVRAYPAVGGDEVGVVLHGFGPVVHQVLVDVVGVEQRCLAERVEQTPRRWSRSAPWGGRPCRTPVSCAVVVVSPVAKRLRRLPCWKAVNSAWPKMADFTSVSGSFEARVAGAARGLEQRGAHAG